MDVVIIAHNVKHVYPISDAFDLYVNPSVFKHVLAVLTTVLTMSEIE
jgi:hypothetical protein